ncbi:MAG TPA: NifB/NifX family molybdenum-iron cluster-binding protein [Methanocella sp.]|uniref:NifB/NifX family molybdenum-iron cluster-binding protein n=1 Tax=Methanocella sp. TaxID=2052833 RepID=UPI002CA3896B|nr:NifB/NifX family molybdenum-iron cluster-binding protein [Methanocella sp.]HTY90342.1 NifB/NifX family molybdenum-iron cluster-binding protein [Methanocella sp.]
MKLGIPVVAVNGTASEINEHFGMSEHFAILDVEGDKIVKIDFVSDRADLREHKTPAALLGEKGVNIVLAGGIGPHMIKELLDAGLLIYRGAVGDVEQAFEDYKAGMLTEVRTAGDME